jgi:RNA polymerase sigma-70 factor (ECF subfamily)
MNKRTDHKMSARRRQVIAILPNVRRFALSLTGSMADADDLLQSTVERMLERGLPDDAPLLPYSLKTCRNLWIDELRSRKVREAAAASGDPVFPGNTMVCGEQQVLEEISLREVQVVLAEMPAEQRAVLELVAVEGYSYREAAQVLDIPIGTVMSRLARGRIALVERLRNGMPAESRLEEPGYAPKPGNE